MKIIFAEAELVLQELFLKIPVVRDFQINAREEHGFYAEIHMRGNEYRTIYVATLDRAVPQRVTTVISQRRNGTDYMVIMAPYISEASAKICEEAGIGYCDYSGNCMICLDTLYVFNKGNPNKYPKEDHAKTVFNPSARTTSMILRELMKDVSKVWKIKALSEKVGCSIGMVSRVKTYLCEQQWAAMDQSGLKIVAPEALMKEWSKAYMIRDMIGCYTYDSIPEFEGKCFKACLEEGVELCLSGISGGVRYAPVVRYTKTHIWISPKDVSAFLQMTGCKIVDSGANVVLYIASGQEVFMDCREINNSIVASPVQVYLDCMRIKGRGEEMAEAVFTKEIRK